MFIKNNNFYIMIFIGILVLFSLNLIKEKFKVITCPPGEIEGSDGNCKCPLVGQIYDVENNKCKCDKNKTEQIVNDQTICI